MTVVNDELITLLPDNATAFEASQSAVDQRLLASDTNLIRQEREAATCTVSLLPFLAWERSVHHWTGTETIDRARVASSFEDHAGYGSPDALEAEIQIDLAFDALSIREYWQVPGFAWPDFQVVIHVVADGPVLPAASDVYASVIRRKNVRDWPGEVLYEAQESGPLGFASVGVLNGTINSLPLDPTPHDFGPVYYGAAGALFATINSRPL